MHKQKQNYTYHPFELAFCGYSNSGKTTLITQLIKTLSKKYKIGYIKHDVHKFCMDHEGKDTYQVRKSGAHTVFISDSEHSACIHGSSQNLFAHQPIFLESDIVLVEGYKSSDIPKIVLLDKDKTILEDLKNQKFTNIVAVVGPMDVEDDISEKYPYFHRDDIEGIKQCVLRHISDKIKETPLYGLVLAGGRSTRMKKDKSLLNYHGKPQIQHASEFLTKFCTKVFISNRDEQSEIANHSKSPQIHDTFLNIGPLGGILSAMTTHPNAAWLVLACDLPFITDQTIEYLIKNRHPFKFGSAYKSAQNDLPEPLCAIYEPKFRPRLFQFLGQGLQCPRKILINSDIALFDLPEKSALNNVNHPEEYVETKNILSTNRAKF